MAFLARLRSFFFFFWSGAEAGAGAGAVGLGGRFFTAWVTYLPTYLPT